MSEHSYLHGFSQTEQNRLREQALLLEPQVYQHVPFHDHRKILEVGCGVGAQTEILLRRFPKAHITGIDLNEKQLEAARAHLESLSWAKGRWELQLMSADDMRFAAHSFDAAFLCWILEHVPSPARVLAEVRRMLRPGGDIMVTEVMNSSFFLDPYSPNVWKYWMAFNDFQHDHAGDPFVGAKLGNLLSSVGFRHVDTHARALHYDNRHPEKRREIIAYWTDLLLSGSDALIQAGRIDRPTVDAVARELKAVAGDPNAVFFYSFMQAHARAES